MRVGGVVDDPKLYRCNDSLEDCIIDFIEDYDLNGLKPYEHR